MSVSFKDFEEFMKHFNDCYLETTIISSSLVTNPFKMFCLDKMKERERLINENPPKRVDGIKYRVIPNKDRIELFLVEFKRGVDELTVDNYIKNLNEFLSIEENIYKVCSKRSTNCPFNHNKCPKDENNNYEICQRADSYFKFCREKIDEYKKNVNILEQQLDEHKDPIKNVKYYLEKIKRYSKDSIMLDMMNKPTESLSMVLPALYCEVNVKKDLQKYKFKIMRDFRYFIDNYCDVILYVVTNGKNPNVERSKHKLRSDSANVYYNKLKETGIIKEFNIIYNDEFFKKFLLREQFLDDCDSENIEDSLPPSLDSVKT